jgi:hypothetical protein
MIDKHYADYFSQYNQLHLHMQMLSIPINFGKQERDWLFLDERGIAIITEYDIDIKVNEIE